MAAQQHATQQRTAQQQPLKTNPCCSSVEQICLVEGRRYMKQARTEGGWVISEIEQLTGLARRDIQRCCYQGKGGIGILSPKGSSWGKRTYSTEDMAVLLVVALEKQAGSTLPEIGETLRAETQTRGENSQIMHAENSERSASLPHETRDMLAIHAARLRESLEKTAGQLLSAQALLLATGKSRQAKLGQLVERTLTRHIEEACSELEMSNSSIRAALEPGWLSSRLESIETCEASSADCSQTLLELFADVADKLHASCGISHVNACHVIEYALDAPGIPLAIELWLGPGMHEQFCQAIR